VCHTPCFTRYKFLQITTPTPMLNFHPNGKTKIPSWVCTGQTIIAHVNQSWVSRLFCTWEGSYNPALKTLYSFHYSCLLCMCLACKLWGRHSKDMQKTFKMKWTHAYLNFMFGNLNFSLLGTCIVKVVLKIIKCFSRYLLWSLFNTQNPLQFGIYLHLVGKSILPQIVQQYHNTEV
jgi:hypothetical protein